MASDKPSGGPSRLDGLLGLLDKGGSNSVRRMAAKQIGELVAAHPSETRPVLRKVRRYLRSPVWDTRIAAGHAIAAIADQSPRFVPVRQEAKQSSELLPSPGGVAKVEIKHEVKVEQVVQNISENPAASDTSFDLKGPTPGLTFANLDLERIFSSGAMLFGSSGNEYKTTDADLAAQRARLRLDLGIDDRFSGGGDMLGVKDEDFAVVKDEGKSLESSAAAADEMVKQFEGLSARERNRLKREAKKRAKQNAEANDMRPLKRCRTNDSNPNQSAAEHFSLAAMAAENQGDDEEFESEYGLDWWDFQATCELLKKDLLYSRWERRHGAAVGIREILKRNAHSAGRFTQKNGDIENGWWLEDICCRLLCVLAMDKFGDFVGDAVVAPVRETAAMTMGACTRAMSPDLVRVLLRSVLQLLLVKDNKKWEIRHAGLLGVRYILAVREDMSSELLSMSFEEVLNALRDYDDDVRAAAGEALIPVAQSIVDIMPGNVPKLVATLWDALLDLDDISASTGSVLRLLARVTAIPAKPGYHKLWLDPRALANESDAEAEIEERSPGATSNQLNGDPFCDTLVELVPRLWPFLRHSAKSVRKASINLLSTLVDASSDSDLATWLQPICAEALGRLFRNVLLETELESLEQSKSVWKRIVYTLAAHATGGRQTLLESARPMIPFWLMVAAHESRADAASFDQSRGKAETGTARRRKLAAARREAKARASKTGQAKIPLPENGEDATVTSEGPYDAVVMQYNVAEALGHLAVVWPSEDSFFVNCLLESLKSPYALTRQVACDVCREWASSQGDSASFPQMIVEALISEIELKGGCTIAEIGVYAGALFNDTIGLIDGVSGFGASNLINAESLRVACMQGKKFAMSRDKVNAAVAARTLHQQISAIVTGDVWAAWENFAIANSIQQRHVETVFSVRMRILSSLGFLTHREELFRTALVASAASAMVSAVGIPLPQKVTSFIKALMSSIRLSHNPHVQKMAARSLANLAYRLSLRGAQKPLSLVIKNLTKYLTAADPEAINGVQDSKSSKKSNEPTSSTLNLSPTSLAKQGAFDTFCSLTRRFKGEAFQRLPWLWETICSGLQGSPDEGSSLKSLTVLQCVVGELDSSLHERVSQLLPSVIYCAASPNGAHTSCASKCLADCVAAMPTRGMQIVIRRLVPLLSGSQSDKQADSYVRQGAAQALRAVVDRLGPALIPYAAFLVVPMMKRMVDDDPIVRGATAGVFGVLIRLIPLEGGAPDDPEMSASMSFERQEARKFLGQLLGTEPRTHYELPVSIGDGITLRKYQQECLDWLAFLNRYGLHGALCDDMGLGKTLMTLCVMTGDYVEMQNNPQTICLPSLVVCPSTVVGHWVEETFRFFGHVLNMIVQYTGPPKERARLRRQSDFTRASVVVTSYDVLSNDLVHFEQMKWNYLVLDEGHVIKNPKTKIARAVRSLAAQHRLVLSGTPIQNSVLELWAMFDFLMPGFLGTESSFKQMYGKPILASRDPKCTEADQQRGMVATEALHRQVLPFVLRRLKDDVLSELPPKIVQDYYCNMTRVQLELYEDFSHSMLQEGGLGARSEEPGKTAASGHVFQALNYLRRLCSHPKLVLTKKHSEYHRITNELSAEGRSIDDIDASSKLIGLQNILEECGIGSTSGQGSSGHRVLIFAQLKQMLDIVESDLFEKHMPSVTYMRLDGDVQTSKRQTIVTRFNADPTIDCLLLTTHVGGLGLNLTGADTVIFLEHDWNPTKDLQAMDRAHRMGQRRTVNVYRLITRGTLEEKIMGIQKFKTHIANTVVNRENSSLQSMNTEQLVNLFQIDVPDDDESGRAKKSGDISAVTAGGKGLKAALAGLEELWEEEQYQSEFNVGSFIADINDKNRTSSAGPS